MKSWQKYFLSTKIRRFPFLSFFFLEASVELHSQRQLSPSDLKAVMKLVWNVSTRPGCQVRENLL